MANTIVTDYPNSVAKLVEMKKAYHTLHGTYPRVMVTGRFTLEGGVGILVHKPREIWFTYVDSDKQHYFTMDMDPHRPPGEYSKNTVRVVADSGRAFEGTDCFVFLSPKYGDEDRDPNLEAPYHPDA